ncbi:hypothetical protein [Lacticaseibacillus mingshuiensis]|uniref:Uncharacterized protein n=1 Tax=Lacticaseibacillus mingshuiensis TaxID=2799574 RepID=A0ABW4CIJ2_9LACO|nr:hypothetical protein [Lacticaseibacillus mingshuiensis]
MAMVRSRSEDETTELVKAKQEIVASAADLKWLRKRKRDLIIRWVFYILLWIPYFAMFFTSNVLSWFMLFGPPAIVIVSIEELIEIHYQKKHPKPHKWESNASHFDEKYDDLHRN